MHADTTAPADHDHQARRQALHLVIRAVHDVKVTRADLRVLVVVLSALLGDEDLADWPSLCARCYVSEKQARSSLARLRLRGYLAPLADPEEHFADLSFDEQEARDDA